MEKKPMKLFISYAHEDEAHKKNLQMHLAGLKYAKLIDEWNDREIMPGEKWDDAIKKNLQDSDVVLFLVSPYFMGSSYINDVEINRTIERYNQGEVRIIPVIVEPCEWTLLPLKDFQALPKNAKAISEWDNQHTAYADVAKQLRHLLEFMQTEKKSVSNTTDTSPDNTIPPVSKPSQVPTQIPVEKLDELSDMIAMDRVEDAIDGLRTLVKDVDQDVHNELSLLSARLNATKRNARQNLITNESSNMEQSRIKNAFLSLVDDLRT